MSLVHKNLNWFAVTAVTLLAVGIFLSVSMTTVNALHCEDGSYTAHEIGDVEGPCPSGGTGGANTGGTGDVNAKGTGDVNAKGAGGGGSGLTVLDPLGGKTVEAIFNAVLDIIMVFAIPIILFFIVFAGFQYVTAGGNETKIEQATKALTYAVLGGIIVLGARVLLTVITSTINLLK
ncbi:pilin [Candidatus Pacebacteria bacterium]|nr:pilin [Candidatus Paceibacterota bacterium]